MKKFYLLFALIIAAAISMAGCETAQPKAKNVVPADEQSGLGDAAFAPIKAEFAKVVKPIPFAYKSSALKLKDPKYKVAGVDVDTYMKKIVIPALSKAINALPSGRKCVIVGHASTKGPEGAENGKKGNVALSQERADAVLEYIQKNSSIDSSKLTTRANGSSTPLAGTDGKSDKNARVELILE